MIGQHTCINGGGGGGNPGPTGWPPPAEGWGIITMGWPCNILSDLREPARDCESPMNPLFISPPKKITKINKTLLNIGLVESYYIFIPQYYICLYLYKLSQGSCKGILRCAWDLHRIP